MIRRGDCGVPVVEVQRLLTAYGFWTEQNGEYGEQTEAKVKTFQRLHGIKPTGEVDDATMGALRAISETTFRAVKP